MSAFPAIVAYDTEKLCGMAGLIGYSVDRMESNGVVEHDGRLLVAEKPEVQVIVCENLELQVIWSFQKNFPTIETSLMWDGVVCV